MTEKEKMLSGLSYNSRDPELILMYHEARGRIATFNSTASAGAEKRRQILEELLGSIGERVWIESPFYCDYGKFISIGEGTFVNVNCMFLDDNYISIGKETLIGPYVQIYTAGHPLKASERIHGDGSYSTVTKPVIVGNRVWIGGNSVVFPGVTVGNNVTIGAGSVVTKDIPDDVLAYGNPCRIIRKL